MQVEVNPLHLTCVTSHAEIMAKHGMPLTRNAPSLADTRRRYMLDEFAGTPIRTWKQAAPVLRQIKNQVDAQMRELRPEAMR